MLVLVVYLHTVGPGIAGGDSGELVAESCHLGTAHPPGYPLFTLLNHATIRGLPWVLDFVGIGSGPRVDGRASPAWRANATSAVMGTLAVVFTAQTTTLLCQRWTRDKIERRHPSATQDLHTRSTNCCNAIIVQQRWWDNDRTFRVFASGCTAMLMAFSPLVWQYSVTAEVFALNNCLLSLLCSLTLRFSFKRELIHAVAGALVSGLALSNQHTAVLFVVPLAAWVVFQLFTSRSRLHSADTTGPWRRLALDMAVLALAFLLGLAPYAYLPLAAQRAPKRGSWGDVATWSGLWHHLRRGDYGSLKLYSGGAGGDNGDYQDLVNRLQKWFRDVSSVQGLDGIVPVLAFVGLLWWYVPVPGWATLLSGRTAAGKKTQSPTAGVRLAPSSGSIQARNATVSCKAKGSHRSRAVPVVPASEAKPLVGQSLARRGGGARRDNGVENNNISDKESATLVGMLGSWDDGGQSAPTALLTALGIYLVVFHYLSNMPLDSPLFFGIHARFWMQPNIIVFVFCGTGLHRLFDLMRFVGFILSRENEVWQSDEVVEVRLALCACYNMIYLRLQSHLRSSVSVVGRRRLKSCRGMIYVCLSLLIPFCLCRTRALDD